jgi:acyl carrier protein
MNSATYDTIKTIIVEYLRLEEDEITPETHIVNDIGADSLALVELAFKFCERFNIPMINPSDELFIIRNLVDHVERSRKAGEKFSRKRDDR